MQKIECYTPAPERPKIKLSGLKVCPNGLQRHESKVIGSISTNNALGTNFRPKF
jgi:hypothetical protein